MLKDIKIKRLLAGQEPCSFVLLVHVCDQPVFISLGAARETSCCAVSVLRMGKSVEKKCVWKLITWNRLLSVQHVSIQISCRDKRLPGARYRFSTMKWYFFPVFPSCNSKIFSSGWYAGDNEYPMLFLLSIMLLPSAFIALCKHCSC